MLQLSDAVRLRQTPETLQVLGYAVPEAQRQPAAKAARPTPGEMTKTEARYMREVLQPQAAAGAISGIVFQPFTLRLANGHRYTPDFGFMAGRRAHFTEVKGSYRLHSHQRARLAFDQAAVEWPCFIWIWAELGTDGVWKTTTK